MVRYRPHKAKWAASLTKCRRVTVLESRHRRMNIRLRGIPERVGGEDLLHFIRRLIAKMGLIGGADPSPVISVFRVRKDRAPRDTIIVTKDVTARDNVMARPSAPGLVSPLYVSHKETLPTLAAQRLPPIRVK
ncbi:Hypothetical predicted protein [Pelobates cultripes]|uniref:Uncharacterized protein n=1 Tax=Pelobates cultripes TaxID=61616 RepID=A0AAD1S257_PELCU|nr:Hypothetical predicted protein [Pelobates cultripes]